MGQRPDGGYLMRESDGTEWVSYLTPEQDAAELRDRDMLQTFLGDVRDLLAELYVAQRFGDPLERLEALTKDLHDYIDAATDQSYYVAVAAILEAVSSSAYRAADARTRTPDTIEEL